MNFKKFLYILFVSIFIFSKTNFCFAQENVELDISAPSAVLVDAESGKVLYDKSSDEVRSCASITKIMTLILVMEAIESGKLSLSDKIIASEHASSMGGSDIWLEPGEAMSADDMIKAVVVASANDAAVALAEQISGTEEAFVSEMNQKAKELGMNNTTFKNCNGLDEDGHVTTAYDISLMARELMKHKSIFNYTSIWIDYLRNGKTQLVNTNKLLKSYSGITGLKTGTTSEAGCCIVATAKKNNLELVAVVLGDKTGKERFASAAKLLDFGFANYEVMTPKVPENMIKSIKVKNGTLPEVPVSVTIDKNILVKKGQERNITSELQIVSEAEAPFEQGKLLGKLIYKNANETVAEYDVIAATSVEKINFFAAVKGLYLSLIRL